MSNHITEHDKAECLGHQVEYKFSGEAMTSKVLRKINAKSKSLYRKPNSGI